MKYHLQKRDKSSLYHALGTGLRRAAQRTTFHFLGLNIVGEMRLAMGQTPRVPSDQRMQHSSRGLREDTFLACSPKVDNITLGQAGIITNDADTVVHSFKSAFVI